MNLFENMTRKFDTFYQLFRLTGLWGIITYKPIFKALFKNKYLKLHVKDYENPIWFRYGSSDSTVFCHIFLQHEYSCLNDLKEPRLIIDCGANVGYSSIYFLNKYAHAHVIAIAPDDENFRVCQKNLAPYANRVSLIHSGVWSHKTGLIITEDEHGNGQEWAIQVKECLEGQDPDLYSTDIATVLGDSGFSSIDLLKIDIEGSEIAVFSGNYENWLNKVENIAIELHGEECERKFFNALSDYDYQLSKFSELTLCKRIACKTLK